MLQMLERKWSAGRSWVESSSCIMVSLKTKMLSVETKEACEAGWLSVLVLKQDQALRVRSPLEIWTSVRSNCWVIPFSSQQETNWVLDQFLLIPSGVQIEECWRVSEEGQ